MGRFLILDMLSGLSPFLLALFKHVRLLFGLLFLQFCCICDLLLEQQVLEFSVFQNRRLFFFFDFAERPVLINIVRNFDLWLNRLILTFLVFRFSNELET